MPNSVIVQKNTSENFEQRNNFNKKIIQQDFINKQRQKLEVLKQDIKSFKMKNKEEADNIIKKYNKRKAIQVVCSFALSAILSTLSTKTMTHGYPFIVDDIKYYHEIGTFIDEEGNVKEVKTENYRFCNSFQATNKIDVYHFPTLSQTLTGESILYVEKYSVEGLTAEKIVELIETNELDLKFFGEPEIIPYTFNTEPNLDSMPVICFTTIDPTDFIIIQETREDNKNATYLFIHLIMVYGILSVVGVYCLDNIIFKRKQIQVEIAKELIAEYNQQIKKANQLKKECTKLERQLKKSK